MKIDRTNDATASFSMKGARFTTRPSSMTVGNGGVVLEGRSTVPESFKRMARVARKLHERGKTIRLD